MARERWRPSPGEMSKDNASSDRRRVRLEAIDDLNRKLAAGDISRAEYDAMMSVHS